MNVENFEFVQIDEVLSHVVTHMEVLYFWMSMLILSQLTGSIVVTIKWGKTEGWHIETIEELAKEQNLMCRIVYSNVFRVT